MHLCFRVPNSLSDLGGLRKIATDLCGRQTSLKSGNILAFTTWSYLQATQRSKAWRKISLLGFYSGGWMVKHGELFAKKNMLTLKRNWKWKLGPFCKMTLCISEKNAFVKCHVLKTCGKVPLSKRFWCTKQLGHDETKQFQTAGQLELPKT